MALSPDTLEHPRAHEAHRHVLTILPNSTYEDFAALPEGTRAQLIDGELLIEGEFPVREGENMSPAPNLRHQLIIWGLGTQLRNFVGANDLGIVLGSPVDVRLTQHQVVQPDLVFVAADRLRILGTQEIEEAPDLVVEVLSPSTGTYDLTLKRRLYEEHGVREYWIVDPDEQTIEVLTLTEEGYRSALRVRQTGAISSVLLPGFSADAADLFAKPGP